MSEIEERVLDVFREVFDDPDLVLDEGTTAADVEGWDSLMHINLIVAIEQTLGIKFATAEISRLQEEGQNFGTFLALVRSKAEGA